MKSPELTKDKVKCSVSQVPVKCFYNLVLHGLGEENGSRGQTLLNLLLVSQGCFSKEAEGELP